MPRYAIIDVETTGGQAARERITEIAVVLHDGVQILDTFSSLVNPERSIPPMITSITGITDDMVRDAPKFFEIAKKVVQMTEDAIFVAHNVRFDYSFVREEFLRLGFSYTRKQLCTVRMSRQAFPGLASYSLGNLIKHFQIKVENRHRALADTLATAVIFERIMALDRSGGVALKDLIAAGVKETKLPNHLTMQRVRELPSTCGVYYLHNQIGDVVYVGKSINIQKRIIEHFADMTEKAAKLHAQVHDVTYEETGSELIALLLEADEIKRLRPPVNRAQRQTYFPYALFWYINDSGFVTITTAKNTAELRKKNSIIHEFVKPLDAKSYLQAMTRKFGLCLKINQLDSSSGGCFNYHIKQCHGACVGAEQPDSYNVRAQQTLDAIGHGFKDSFMIFDIGRRPDEASVVLVEDGIYAGFGYLDKSEAADPESIRAAIPHRKGYPDVYKIIRMYINKNPTLRVVKF